MSVETKRSQIVNSRRRVLALGTCLVLRGLACKRAVLALIGAATTALLASSSASAATVQCGHGYVAGVPFAHVTLTISRASMDDIYRPAAFRSRGAADCELASLVMRRAATPHANHGRFLLSGAHFYVGSYRCHFAQTTQELPLGPSPLAEWANCRHRGRDANTVRFMVLEVGQRTKRAEEAEGEKEAPAPNGCGQLQGLCE